MSNTVHFTDSNFQNEVLESAQPVLVDFWAQWCGPCRRVGPTIDELAEQYKGSVKIGKLNVDESPNLAHSFGIQSIPAVLLFKDGQVVEQLVGAHSKERYQQALDNLAA